MASMRKKGKAGNYYARFYDRNRSPQRKEVPLRTTRKDVARRRLTKLERDFETGEFDPWTADKKAEAVSVSEARDAFLSAKSHLRPRTVQTYRKVLKRWIETLPPGLNLRDVSADHIRPYVLKPSLSRASQRKHYRHLNAFFNWTKKAGHLDATPMDGVHQPKAQRKQAAFLSTADLETLLRAINAHMEITEDVAGRSPDLQWLSDMISVGVCTGLRRGELARLRWCDVDLNASLLTVRSRDGAETKSGHERQLPIAPDAADVLRRLSAARTDELDGPVFVDRDGLPIKLSRISHRFKDMVRVARLDDRLHFHSLRHTCGSWLAMKGVPMRVIQAILGHSSVSVTERYSHLQPEVMTKAIHETFG